MTVRHKRDHGSRSKPIFRFTVIRSFKLTVPHVLRIGHNPESMRTGGDSLSE